ncbi:hypothetical protein scyTo_0007328 [Scyliorhinus torazame]|uniref:LTD domain-containing protein n=1 Tax=Scyliorhinus torazame TaxID=75743 RepID=A0A401NQD9_SCYTO|nr:hypothetical protein [Scyliorhinus torazame]
MHTGTDRWMADRYRQVNRQRDRQTDEQTQEKVPSAGPGAEGGAANRMAGCGSIGQMTEKAQLQDLNERFCRYVENVKNITDQIGMASDTSNDLKRIQELEEEMVAARNMYNKEIQALHDKLDQNNKERMQIEMNNLRNSQLIAEFRESILALNAAMLQKEEEKKSMELLLCQKDAELRELLTKSSNPSSEVDDLKRELEKLRCSLDDIQKKYEVEHKQNMELQCTVQQLRYKLDRQQENHCQDMICMREKAAEADAMIQELEQKLRNPQDDGGALKMLQKIREGNEAEMRQYQRQTEQAYNQNIMDLTMCLNKERIQLEQVQEENQCLRQHINNLSTEIKMLQTKLIAEEENKIALIDKLNCEQQKNQQHINDLKMRLEEMEDLLLAKMKELSSRKDISLQGDISAFKCMLESEERRLSDSNQSHTMGNMKIIEVATNGHFVRLLNISLDTEEDIGSYALQQNIDGHPVTVYRFPPRTRVNAGSGVTVWAAAAKVPHNPPKDFLLKESNKFGTGPECTTILCKPNGQAVAWFTPAPRSSKLNNPCNGGKFTDYEHPFSAAHDSQLNFQSDKGNGEIAANTCQFLPEALPMK